MQIDHRTEPTNDARRASQSLFVFGCHSVMIGTKHATDTKQQIGINKRHANTRTLAFTHTHIGGMEEKEVPSVCGDLRAWEHPHYRAKPLTCVTRSYLNVFFFSEHTKDMFCCWFQECSSPVRTSLRGSTMLKWSPATKKGCACVCVMFAIPHNGNPKRPHVLAKVNKDTLSSSPSSFSLVYTQMWKVASQRLLKVRAGVWDAVSVTEDKMALNWLWASVCVCALALSIYMHPFALYMVCRDVPTLKGYNIAYVVVEMASDWVMQWHVTPLSSSWWFHFLRSALFVRIFFVGARRALCFGVHKINPEMVSWLLQAWTRRLHRLHPRAHI